MKKKVLMTILPVCVAMTMTACGGNADTVEVEETAVTEESAEPDAQAEKEAETPTVDEEAVEPEQTEDEAPADEESSEEIENDADGAVNNEEFPIIGDYVVGEDKSDEYGVYSTSCFDLDQYLDENGELTDEITAGAYSEEYSGRWAYPEFTPCEMLAGLTMNVKTDRMAAYDFAWNENYDAYRIIIYSGLADYNFIKDCAADFANDEVTIDMGVPTYLCDVTTTSGTSEVYLDPICTLVEGDNGESVKSVGVSVEFHVGNFTVSVSCPETTDLENAADQLKQEDIQMVADNIHLKGE